jgi:hypothetical protein
MNEYIEVQLRRNDRPLRIRRQVPGGVELDESDPIERTVYVGFDPADVITKFRMQRVRQIQAWDPSVFKLHLTVEDGTIVIRGVDRHSLPEGRYNVTIRLEEATTKPEKRMVTVPHDGFGVQVVNVKTDERDVDVDLTDCDAEIQRVLDASSVNELPAVAWLDGEFRPARKACLLNLLASLRVQPLVSDHLLTLVESVYYVANDRIYARVDRSLYQRLEALAVDPKKPFYREGRPHADIHLKLLEGLPEPPETIGLFRRDSLVSFRGEGRPTLQVVVAEPPAGLRHTYAEFDLDLGNPLQDLVGFVVHMGELLDGKPTNHLDLAKALKKGKARDFLLYTVVA